MPQQTVNITTPTPEKIMQVGMGYWTSKALLAAVKFDLFSQLAGGKQMSADQVKEHFGLKTTTRHVADWLDVLHSLGFLQREGVWTNATYSNGQDAEIFLDKNKPSYMGGILDMGNNRLYKFWGNLEEGLLTGKPQNESKYEAEDGNMGFFTQLYEDPQKLQEFMDAMSGIQSGNFTMLVKKFDFGRYRTMLDIGGADGTLCIQVCLSYPGITCITYDLPPVEPLALKKIEKFNLSSRISALSGDFLKDPFPSAEIITMGNILHGLEEETKQQLINKAYAVLAPGGVLIAIENIIDDGREKNMFGMLMSLNMLIENGDAFDYMPSDFNKWSKKAGFKKTEFMPLAGPASAAIAYK